MTTSVLDMKLSFLLDIAKKIQSSLSTNIDSNEIVKIVLQAVKKHNAIVAHDVIASDGYEFMIISAEPVKVFYDIIQLLRDANSKKYQDSYNPINIITKLVDREFLLDTGGIRMCYGVNATVPSNYLLKSFACRIISSVRSYYNYVNSESFVIDRHKVEELHPLYDYQTKKNRILGGKKKTKTTKEKRTGNVRINILSRLIEYIRGNSVISNGLIIVNELNECSSSAINIIYTENKFKDAVIDYLKLLIADSYSSSTFKAFLHADFSIPYDFMMKKYSCLMNDKTTNQATYIANLYNCATYDPIPCVKSVIRESFIHIAHPLIKLRFLYIDMFMIEHKTRSTEPIHHEKINQSKMLKAFYDLETFDLTPIWVGYYKDETYEMNKLNLKMKMTNPIETDFI